MKKILYLCLVVLILSSCSGKRYGHYSYVKKENKEAKYATKVLCSEKKTQNELKQLLVYTDFGVNKGSTEIALPVSTIPQSVKEKQSEKVKQSLIVTNNQKTVTQSIEKQVDIEKEENNTATASFILGLAGVFLALLSIIAGLWVLLLLTSAMELAAFIAAIVAFVQISKEPDKYSNKLMAVAGLALSIAYFIVFLLLLLIIVLIIAAL